MVDKNDVVQDVIEVEPVKPEITVEGLQKELSLAQETSQKNEDNWKNEVRVKTKKDQEIQRLREQLSGNESQSDMIKALIAMQASQKNQSPEDITDTIKTQQPDLLKQYEQIVKSSERKRELDRATNRIKTVQDRTEALKVEGDEYDIIRAFATAGEYDKANQRLDAIETAKQTKPPESKETEDERVERLAEQKLKAKLEEKGLLTQDAGTPSASTMNRKQKIKAYAEGTISTKEYEAAL